MKNSLKTIFATMILALIISCNDNIEIQPISQIDSSGGFQTESDIRAGIIGCYSSIQNGSYWGLRYFALGDLYSDNLTHVGTFPSFAQIANKNILPDNVEMANMWNNIYSGINRMNTVLYFTPQVAASDKSLNANATLGEIQCLRAFQYFNLLRFFGGGETGFNKSNGKGIPLITTPTLSAKDTTPVARATEADTWKLIQDDLNFAESNLPNTTATGRVNKRVARALKARAHLYKGEWAQAEAVADSVIKTGGFTLLTGANYANIWLQKNSSEAIWELQFDANNANSIAFFYYPTSRGGRNELNSSATLKSAHEANDVRLVVNVATNPANATQKFTRVDGTDNVVLIRLAEMYLIRAEARAMLNKLTDALADLNVIRKRAGLPDSNAATQTDLINAIEKERRIEFAHEGHRWFDLRRLNKISSVGITQPFRALWPIPQREVLTSGGIIAQNTGY
jgi:hypothetical protein